jgi:signal peptidase I
MTEDQDTLKEDSSSSEDRKSAHTPSFRVFAILRASLQAVVVAIVLFALIVTFVVQGYCVSGNCMDPSLRTGERILGSKIVYRFESPARGDIVVFKYPEDPNKIFIKRIIGLPGETIEMRAGQVYINGNPLREPYLLHDPHGSYGPEQIKLGYLFVMGDNRDQSNDSRYWGELPIKNVQAKAWIRYWPMDSIELVK